MYLEAEKLLRELIACSKDGMVYCDDVRSAAFSELKEYDMFVNVRPYASGGAYVKLSTKALHYFEEKEAKEKRKKEEQDRVEQERVDKKAWDIKLVILSNIVTTVVGFLLGFLFRTH
ncbi:MAG: hypothetical protein KHZ79_01200 [Atopobium minutum]|uniref:hypothetical protein n=1 Tax=Atopobium minutum TaxID=1381 RepID=UPI001DF86EB4|nr:hypothetical protein [Atopobium minutum]MBS4872988.1 hypothetical protein [Atopobium minutum]